VSLHKPDTTGGFAPPLLIADDVALPSLGCVRADGRLDASILSPALQLVLLRAVRVRNIVSSMLIEGERVDLARAVSVLDSGVADTPNERAILQISRVYDRIAHGTNIPLTVSSLCKVHGEIFDGVLPQGGAGRLKSRANAIVEVGTNRILFIPTPPERVAEELESLFGWLEEMRYRYPPPVVAGVVFAEFQGIHPFSDGNGRTGRLLNLSLLAQLGLKNAPLVPLDAQFFRTRARYYEMLATTNSGKRYDLWLRYFVKQLGRAYGLSVAHSDLREVVDRFEGRAVRSVLTWILSGSGTWFKHGDFPNPNHFSLPAITQALRKLTVAGVLQAEGERRGRKYRLSPGFVSRLDSSSQT